jgi:hypothetical protein
MKDMPWSHIGKDELDKAAELVFNRLRDASVPWDCVFDAHSVPYHLQSSDVQAAVQQCVVALLGTTVPTLLLAEAKRIRDNGADPGSYAALTDLAYDLETEHGG